jgi:hypothetical protein
VRKTCFTFLVVAAINGVFSITAIDNMGRLVNGLIMAAFAVAAIVSYKDKTP